jgi:hypothetical protein
VNLISIPSAEIHYEEHCLAPEEATILFNAYTPFMNRL